MRSLRALCSRRLSAWRCMPNLFWIICESRFVCLAQLLLFHSHSLASSLYFLTLLILTRWHNLSRSSLSLDSPSIVQVDPDALILAMTQRTVMCGKKNVQVSVYSARQAEQYRDVLATAVHDVLIRSVAGSLSGDRLAEPVWSDACLSELLAPDLLLHSCSLIVRLQELCCCLKRGLMDSQTFSLSRTPGLSSKNG